MFSRAVGREELSKQISLASVGSAPSVSATLVYPCSWCVCFPNLHCSGSRLLFQGLSEAGPVLSALPRSKPPRFRSSSTPQRRRFDWACVLCPSPVRAAQVTRCFASCNLLPPPSHCSVFWVYNGCTFSGVPCVSSGELVSGWDPPSRC